MYLMNMTLLFLWIMETEIGWEKRADVFDRARKKYPVMNHHGVSENDTVQLWNHRTRNSAHLSIASEMGAEVTLRIYSVFYI